MATGSPAGHPSNGRQLSKQRITKRRGHGNQQRSSSAGVFSCFSLAGDDVSLHKRAAFSSSRKQEVRGIRKKGACLRCRMLKRACSGEDPCKTCIIAARAAAGSRALMWMECIRPSFQMMNIFDGANHAPDQGRIEYIIKDLMDDDVHLDFHIPFALNVEAASSHLASWLSDDHSEAKFSVVGVFSCSTNTSLLDNALDPNLAKDLRLFVHLTTHLYTTGMQGSYQVYSDEEICSVRDFVGSRLLLAFDTLLRPSELEASEEKLGKLKSLFLLILGTTVGMRYTCPEVIDEPKSNNDNPPGPELKQEALMRLLCHYLIYIGKATSVLDVSSDEKALVSKWRSQWNKPAAFTWDSSKGLEMHYRIQPPADYIVSSSEDESMNSINFDLSESDDGDEFTLNVDLLKCTACNAFWGILDTNGFCQNCHSPFETGWAYQDLNATSNSDSSVGTTAILDTDTNFEHSLSTFWNDYSSWDLSSPFNMDISSHCIPLQESHELDSSDNTGSKLPTSTSLLVFDSCSPATLESHGPLF